MSAQNDDICAIMNQMSQGSISSFQVFYERYGSFIFHIALKLTGEKMEAEDLCHDVFIEVLETSGQYNPARGSVEAWLAVKTKCRCLDRLRKKHRYRMEAWNDSAAFLHAKASVEDEVMSKLEQDHLLLAIQNIPDIQGKVVYGKYFQSKTQTQMAQQLEKPIGTIKSLIRYGLQNLKKHYNQQERMESVKGGKRRDG